jgi:hypothetical protein
MHKHIIETQLDYRQARRFAPTFDRFELEVYGHYSR